MKFFALSAGDHSGSCHLMAGYLRVSSSGSLNDKLDCVTKKQYGGFKYLAEIENHAKEANDCLLREDEDGMERVSKAHFINGSRSR